MQAGRVAQLIDRVADIRRGGSAALDLCFVAAGRVDGYYEEFLNVWDLAAGELIAREAGCLSAPIGGLADPSGIVVAAPGVFGELHDAVATTR
ncbi:MAG: inositol monophosphatase family protein [Ilumatobacteraceae bacterium]